MVQLALEIRVTPQNYIRMRQSDHTDAIRSKPDLTLAEILFSRGRGRFKSDDSCPLSIMNYGLS